MENYNALNIVHSYLSERIRPGDLCIDATAGRGRDTLFLAELVGDSGKVLSFDIQKDALDSTRLLCNDAGVINRVKLIHDGHENMSKYAQPSTVDAITFNLGWLPGGDHSIFTRTETTIKAIDSALKLVKIGGIITICIYYGRDCGFEEKNNVLEYLQTLNHYEYTVLVTSFANRPNNPPIPVCIRREI